MISAIIILVVVLIAVAVYAVDAWQIRKKEKREIAEKRIADILFSEDKVWERYPKPTPLPDMLKVPQ